MTWFYHANRCAFTFPEAITLTNKGPGVLDIKSIATSNRFWFSQTNNCGSTLAVGHSCSITVTWHYKTGNYFAPETGKLLITDNGVVSPQSVKLQGNYFCLL
jgi:hypothetical protein